MPITKKGWLSQWRSWNLKSKVLWSSENSLPINKHGDWFTLVPMITGTGNCFVCLQNRRFQFCFPKYRSYDNTLGNCFFQISSYSRAYVCTHNFRKDKESSSPGLSIGKTKHTIECFHMTSRRPYWCPKTMKRRPCWCPKPVLWEMNSFLMQMISFVPKHLHRCWPREWKHSIMEWGTPV